ncbi:unnamed protein product [Closterium sp. NIES-64]|nr:unnamed protein product [Closterium sp. NIES-64]
MVTLFSVECGPYFDWQTVGLMHSYRRSKQPGPITRLLSCTEEQLKDYPNMDLAPTHTVPSMSLDPKTGEWYPAINKPYGVWHWVQHSPQAQQVEWVVILDADMVIRAPVTPWGVKADKGKPVAAYYGYLIGCDNILAQLHTKHPELCPKVGGFIVMHIDDLRRFAPLWLSKTQEVRADKAHYARNITGDVYSSGWISEMYGYSFGVADAGLHHQVDRTTMLYPGYTPTPGVDPRLLHYGLAFSVGNWSFGKSQHRTDKIVNECNRLFDPPPFPSEIIERDKEKKRGLLLSLDASIQSSLGPAAFGPTVSSQPEGGMLRREVRGAADSAGVHSSSLPFTFPSHHSLFPAHHSDGADGDDGGADADADGDGNNKQEQGKAGDQAEGQAQGESSEQQKGGSKGIRSNRGRGRGRGGDDKSPPLADTTEKLHKWMDKWRKTIRSLLPSSFQDASRLPILEIDSPPPVPLPLPNLGPDVPVDPARDPNLWQPFHVKGTPRLVTLFSGECTAYFDWQTLGLMYSFRRSGQPGKLVRLLACNEDMLKEYKGLDLAPTMVVPNWDHDPHNGDWCVCILVHSVSFGMGRVVQWASGGGTGGGRGRVRGGETWVEFTLRGATTMVCSAINKPVGVKYSAINKPVGVKYWLDNSPDAQQVDFVLILDADQILRRPILPWELGAERGRPVSADYGYLIGCDNILGSLHMKHPKHCDKVGGYIAIHVDDLRLLAPRWIAKTEEVRADKEHYATNITGDVYGQGWISEMYGYSFGASDANLHHVVIDNIMLYPGYPPVPNIDPRLFHYGLEVKVLNYSWDKSRFRDTPLALTCGYHFPDPPDVTDLPPLPSLNSGAAAAGGKGGIGGLFAGLRGGGGGEEERVKKLKELQEERRKEFIVIECVAVLNRALREYHRLRLGCPASGEKDVGVMDLTGASFIESGSGGGGVRELRADVWARVRDGGEGMEVEEERRTGRTEEGNGDVERVGRFVVESVEVRERGGLERGLVVGVEMAEGERERMEERMEERMREEDGQEGGIGGVGEVGVEEQQGQNKQGNEENHIEQQQEHQQGEEQLKGAGNGEGGLVRDQQENSGVEEVNTFKGSGGGIKAQSGKIQQIRGLLRGRRSLVGGDLSSAGDRAAGGVGGGGEGTTEGGVDWVLWLKRYKKWLAAPWVLAAVMLLLVVTRRRQRKRREGREMREARRERRARKKRSEKIPKDVTD